MPPSRIHFPLFPVLSALVQVACCLTHSTQEDASNVVLIDGLEVPQEVADSALDSFRRFEVRQT